MNKVKGKAVYQGVALGKIHILEKQEYEIKREQIQDVQAELARVLKAKEKAAAELEQLRDKAMEEVGEEGAEIVQIQLFMLDDEDYQESIEEKITSGHMNAESAVWETGEEFAEVFSTMDNDYMKERASDVKDITKRIVRILCNVESTDILTEPVIIVADDLSPSETVVLDKSKILVIAFDKNGHYNSSLRFRKMRKGNNLNTG